MFKDVASLSVHANKKDERCSEEKDKWLFFCLLYGDRSRLFDISTHISQVERSGMKFTLFLLKQNTNVQPEDPKKMKVVNRARADGGRISFAMLSNRIISLFIHMRDWRRLVRY